MKLLCIYIYIFNENTKTLLYGTKLITTVHRTKAIKSPDLPTVINVVDVSIKRINAAVISH